MRALPEQPMVSADRRARLDRFTKSTSQDPPPNIAERIREALHVDLSSTFAGLSVAHPFGKASGQLSCTLPQVEADLSAGIGFIVLKTVIAEDGTGARSMGAWAEPETRMRVETRPARDGRQGWTVTWKGRGWHRTLEEYGTFLRNSIAHGSAAGVPIVPSVKYHLPAAGESYRAEEYRHTTHVLRNAWREGGAVGPLALEKDFSPTLAGDQRSGVRDTVLEWLVSVPRLIAEAVPDVHLGVKVMNALDDDAFQSAMLDVLSTRTRPRPHFLTVFNRLFDSEHRVAYGGWDLSDRNLRVLDRARDAHVPLPPLSGTGNICSGRVMLEYAMRGCETGQLHTFFQIPRRHYTAMSANRTACALHTLLLHPREGLVPWIWHLEERGTIVSVNGELRFRDVIDRLA
jgi:hypothetical protein